MFIGNVDITVVNVAIPSIRDHPYASDLIVSGYTLAYATLLIADAGWATSAAGG